MTPVQAALDGAIATLQTQFPATVQLAAAPGVNLTANTGTFRRQRAQESTGYSWIITGRVFLRRAVLVAAGITADPQSGDQLTVDGQTYQIQFVSPGTVSFALDCFYLE